MLHPIFLDLLTLNTFTENAQVMNFVILLLLTSYLDVNILVNTMMSFVG